MRPRADMHRQIEVQRKLHGLLGPDQRRAIAMALYPGRFNGRGREVGYIAEHLAERIAPVLRELAREAEVTVQQELREKRLTS